MQSDAGMIELVDRVFGHCRRPLHFTNYKHCSECLEHDELLRSRNLATLQIEDVGNVGWDPLCMTTPQGFSYYFPALARLALAPADSYYGWYASQLLFHLNYEGAKNRHWQNFSGDQRDAVRTLLRHLLDTRSQQLQDYMCAEDLLMILETWAPISTLSN